MNYRNKNKKTYTGYRECQFCGRGLDPQEKCDCQKEQTAEETKEKNLEKIKENAV